METILYALTQESVFILSNRTFKVYKVTIEEHTWVNQSLEKNFINKNDISSEINAWTEELKANHQNKCFSNTDLNLITTIPNEEEAML